MNYRKATIQDIPHLVTIRKMQLIDEGIEPSIHMDEELTQYFYEKLSEESLIEWLAEEDGKIIATAAIIFYDFPPCFTNRTGKKGYIANVYTDPKFRRRGIATGMLDLVVNEAKQRDIQELWLEASKWGRSVYEKYGFQKKEQWMDMKI